jgi:hypothetical protein
VLWIWRFKLELLWIDFALWFCVVIFCRFHQSDEMYLFRYCRNIALWIGKKVCIMSTYSTFEHWTTCLFVHFEMRLLVDKWLCCRICFSEFRKPMMDTFWYVWYVK